ncbi:transposable element Tcb2 transposase [Trichonephila clavipes]|uniref:Transposable element Tcb2 transposase n=1 Tax=Trichonephila clavipes TaxID=2585209 RepID=A0A8X7BCA8_TRICX|nr:transposable element Tcb2 transposase [Trichonephila clavipes]
MLMSIANSSRVSLYCDINKAPSGRVVSGIDCQAVGPGIPFTENYRRLRLQWAHEHRAWQADWHQVVFSDESSFNLSDHDGRIRVKRYAGEHCLPECVIERHSGLKPGVMALAKHMQLLPWPAYSPDMSPIEHLWDLVGWRFAQDPPPAASKDELLLRTYKKYGILFHKQTFKI